MILLLAGLAPLVAETGVAVPEMAEFDAAIQSVMNAYRIPGAALAVEYQGRLILARGFGLADRDRLDLVQPDSIFRVASISKTINGIAAMKLVEQGKLRLDDLAFGQILAHYAPPLPGAKLALYDRITVRQLLQHTAGFPVDAGDIVNPSPQQQAAAAFGGNVTVPSAEQLVRWQLARSLIGSPGQAYAYSNGGVVASGRVIEHVSGRPYERFVTEEVLAPLGITRIRLASPLRRNRLAGEVRYHMPAGTAPVSSWLPGEGIEDWPYAFNLSAYEAAGGWAASAVDLARLLGRLNPLRAGAILNLDSLAELTRRPPAPVSQTGNLWYGIGLQVIDQGNGELYLNHSGSLPGTNSLLVRYHARDLTMAAVFNMRAAETADGAVAAINDTARRLETATANYVRSGRPWPSHDLAGLYFADDRARIHSGGIVNAASFRGSNAIAPGEIVTLFGERLGGSSITTAQVTGGRLATEHNGTRVLFDGSPAPLVSTSAGQVTAIVPYAAAGRASVQLEVERLGVRSLPVTLNVTSAAPAIFTANASGTGPAAAQFFRDARIAVLYATGEGLTDPLPRDGELAAMQPLPRPRLPVKVRLSGQEVPVLYAGAAPGFTAGLMQINIEVPAPWADSLDALPVQLQVGEARSPDGVTLLLR